MATLRAAPTRHHHTEQFSGILTDQYLPGPYLKRERGMGKNQSTKWYAKSKLLQQHFATNCKQATGYITRCPSSRHRASPSIAGETADQHCFEVNFA